MQQVQELHELNTEFQELVPRLNSDLTMTSCKELYQQIKDIQNKLYVPNINHLDQQCPVIQARFHVIFDLIFKTNLIGTVINAKTTCLLVNVVFKLQKEYDDFVLTVLRFAEKVEKVLAVLL